MWLLIILFNIIVLVAGFLWFNEKLKKASGLEDIVKKYRKEIDDITLSFNSTSADNILLLESKIDEIKNMIKFLDERIAAYKKIIAEYEKEKSSKIEAHKKIIDLTENIQFGKTKEVVETKIKTRKKDKQSQVIELFDEGLSVPEIARKLDISEEEVRFRLKKGHKL